MDYPQISAGQMLTWLVVAFGMMAAYPFAKALLLHAAIRILKFQILSYWKAFMCVLIGIGATMAVQMVLMGLTLQPGQEFDPDAIAGTNLIAMFLGMLLTPIAEMVSVFLFFKESPGKTIGAIALHYLFFIASSMLIFVFIVAVTILLGLVAG